MGAPPEGVPQAEPLQKTLERLHTPAMAVNDLAKKYGLQPDEVMRAIEKELPRVLYPIYQCEIQVSFDDKGEIELWGYYPGGTHDQLRRVSTNRRTARYIAGKIADALHCRIAYNDYLRFKFLRHSIVRGQIINNDMRGLAVEVSDPRIFGDRPIGFCSHVEQPVNERNRYTVGDILNFYVTKVRAVIVENKIPRLTIGLSRAAVNMPVVMLTEAILRVGSQLPPEGTPHRHIRCLVREPGTVSHLVSWHQVPGSAIRMAEDMLNDPTQSSNFYPGREKIILYYANAPKHVAKIDKLKRYIARYRAKRAEMLANRPAAENVLDIANLMGAGVRQEWD